MGEVTKIEWADATFNPWWGCTKVSEGCQHCYADVQAHRYNFNVWGPTAGRRKMSDEHWQQPLKWDRAAAAAGVRKRVFCASMADVFEGPETCQDGAAFAMIERERFRLFGLIEKTPNLIWLLLTKRPRNILRFVPDSWQSMLPFNVWIGTSVENQAAADERIPVLIQMPCYVRFLSIEPLLGPLDLSPWIAAPGEWQCPSCRYHLTKRTLSAYDMSVGVDANAAREVCPNDGKTLIPASLIQWAIVGGESGPGARPLHPDWVRSLRDECVGARVPFFFKQHGEWLGYQEDAQAPFWISPRGDVIDGHVFPDFSESPSPRGWDADTHIDVVYRHVGKHAAGRMLDGRTWSEFPEPCGGIAVENGVSHA